MADGPYRVLIVDDEADIRMIVGLNVSLAGMESVEAEDGQVALDKLRSEHWDGIVLDLTMPGLDGWEVLRQLQADGDIDDLGVVVLSANGHPTTAREAMELGAHVHIAKPFSPAAIAETVRELMALTPEERVTRRAEMIERAGQLDRLRMKTV